MAFNLHNTGRTGLMDIIRCDEPSYLIWKWHPENSYVNTTTRENSIRWGSSLRVKAGEVAVFVYSYNGQNNYEFIEGPFDKAITTDNLPILADLLGVLYAGYSPFQAEVYFINTAQFIQMKFGVPYFNIFDPEYPEFAIPVAVRGAINFKISNYREFISLHRLIDFSMKDFEVSVRDVLARYIKDVVLSTSSKGLYPVIQIESNIGQISDFVSNDIGNILYEGFGVTVSRLDISAIEIKRDSEGYRDLMAVTKDMRMRTIQAQTEANIENYAETLKIQREENQYAVHKQAQTANMAAYQIESQTAIGTAAADALGKMGGSSAVNLGTGSGFNPASMMAGIAMGSAVGQNLAGAMNNVMNPSAMTPPPIKQVSYHLAIDGQAMGPYTISTIKQMFALNQVTIDTLAWTTGMADWKRIADIDELKAIFAVNAMPPIPNIPPIPTDK